MIRMINRLTGTEMYVAESRKEEYLSAGHRLADVPCDTPVKRKESGEEKPKKKANTKKKG